MMGETAGPTLEARPLIDTPTHMMDLPLGQGRDLGISLDATQMTIPVVILVTNCTLMVLIHPFLTWIMGDRLLARPGW